MPYSNPATQREYQRKRVKGRRDEWIASRGGSCERCGSDERLEVDHVDPTTKTWNPREIWNRRDEDRFRELNKCQVLCYVCHKEKTRSEQLSAEHGHTYYVRYKCRCETCRADHAATMR